jgi:hypothetical protein
MMASAAKRRPLADLASPSFDGLRMRMADKVSTGMLSTNRHDVLLTPPAAP